MPHLIHSMGENTSVNFFERKPVDNMRDQLKIKSAFTSAQSDQNIGLLTEAFINPRLSTEAILMYLIILNKRKYRSLV